MLPSGHRQHGKHAQPLCFARDAPRFSHRVQLGLACFACYAGDAVVQKIASSSYESCLDLSVRWPKMRTLPETRARSPLEAGKRARKLSRYKANQACTGPTARSFALARKG
eukprot:scaffold85538_cov35-Phaeocystis_antarctica.AAC.2